MTVNNRALSAWANRIKKISRVRLFSSLMSSLLPTFLVACGGGDGTTGDVFDAVDSNVALATKGSSTSASFGAGSAPSLIDGDQTSAASWSGNIMGDWVKIDLGRERFIANIKLFTNTVATSIADAEISFEFSTNNATWQSTGYTSGVDLPCSTYSSVTDSQTCRFASREKVRYVRVTVTAPSVSVSGIGLYELEATGY